MSKTKDVQALMERLSTYEAPIEAGVDRLMQPALLDMHEIDVDVNALPEVEQEPTLDEDVVMELLQCVTTLDRLKFLNKHDLYEQLAKELRGLSWHELHALLRKKEDIPATVWTFISEESDRRMRAEWEAAWAR